MLLEASEACEACEDAGEDWGDNHKHSINGWESLTWQDKGWTPAATTQTECE